MRCGEGLNDEILSFMAAGLGAGSGVKDSTVSLRRAGGW